jgi:predicted Na+-dependent transporter
LLKSRVRKNLAIGLVITVVITVLSVVVADDGSKVEELRKSLAVGLLVTGTVTGGTWLLQRRRSAP